MRAVRKIRITRNIRRIEEVSATSEPSPIKAAANREAVYGRWDFCWKVEGSPEEAEVDSWCGSCLFDLFLFVVCGVSISSMATLGSSSGAFQHRLGGLMVQVARVGKEFLKAINETILGHLAKACFRQRLIQWYCTQLMLAVHGGIVWNLVYYMASFAAHWVGVAHSHLDLSSRQKTYTYLDDRSAQNAIQTFNSSIWLIQNLNIYVFWKE